MRRFDSRASVVALAGLLALGVTLACAESATSTREIMSRIVSALQIALPPSFDSDRFQDPDRRAEIATALEDLARNGERLERHSRRSDADLTYLSHSLASDTREIHRRYADGRFEQSRFLLHHLAEVCVACHSRLPDSEAHTLGQALLATEALAKLAPDERARFEIATRQFDRALATLEAWFADPAVSPADIDLTGEYEDYLEVSLRVRRNPERAIGTFEKLLARDDLPERLRQNVEAWVIALGSLADDPPTGSAVDRARARMNATGAAEVERDERAGLVAAIEASGTLHRYVAKRSDPTPELGEAYYLLGMIDAAYGRSFWASQAEHYLETAIRIGPTEPYAEPAFELLEAFVVKGYTGSGGEHVPDDVRERLRELSRLIDRANSG